MLHITSAYARAFLERHLRGSTAPLLDGPSTDFPDVYLRILEYGFPGDDYDALRRSYEFVPPPPWEGG
ncbi:MAG: hypothetical protein GWN79_12440, partial [Actinobacteria bacterium]|nr:hypothetical protein [Actinomycetota bacterium]NIU19849.1 hypothetical protein [Actinomycetota bacterium]NIU67292.1 hypothetical protein [Actinomycetota bacterium]NIV87823.1 hypothetical protein [Actinomycetota bacterium]NIW29077.1 hypothetical protein [Actinomycetota bacterium]